jgi:hypothetical protein
MALNFPTSPELNQVYTSGTRSWRWDGSSWVANNSVTNILGYIPVNKAGDTMSGGLNVPNVNAVTVTANSSGFSIAGGSSASKTLTVSNSVTIAGTDSSTLNIGAGGTLQSGAFQVSSQGTTGAQGVQGTTGIQGSVGTQGTLGTQGSTGAQGTVGGAGIQGSTGSQGTGGAQGATGSQGAQGVQGTQGRTGAQGSTGTQGAVGSTGGTGATGSTGVQGTTGATGAQGTSGATILGNNNAFTGANTFPSISVANSGAGHDPYGAIGVTMPSASNYSYYGLTRSGIIGCAIGIDTSNNMWFGQAGSGSSGTRTATWFYGNSSGDLYGTGSVRAPIFYDSNDTTYYGDFNSTSKQYQAIVFGDSSRYSAVSGTINGTGAGDKLILYGNTSNYDARVLVGADYDVIFKSQGSPSGKGMFRFYSGTSATLALEISATQNTTSTGDFRAPIFYDSNDTAYYVNPNGSSNVAGQWNFQYSVLSRGHSSGDNWMPYTDGNFYIRAPIVYVDNSIRCSSDVRGTIFYDSNNTGYYTDPASTSVINGITVAATYGRSAAGKGYLDGGYSSIESTVTPGPIYCIGTGYAPTASTLGGMYGVGYGYTGGGGITGIAGCGNNVWSFYGAYNGVVGNLLASTGIFTTGVVNAVGNITAYYSDERLKTKLGNIPDALNKVLSLNGFYFEANETAQALGYTKKKEVGVSAQEVEAILPEIIAPAPIDSKYKTLDYSKLVPLLIQAIKEQQQQIENQQKQIEELRSLINNK